ncbi:rho guanine nucleotide exchange factor 3-like isoform X1 [Acipenser ruthenus]|uniref:rho guanine nucleotide exchange factor 3-like isoform X1 n=1 Tax=Acipenser ruthenus TaxID=7906 RepID=UPI002741F390|nr:rho guanine nucleotide exchange factor 3-like isoform X1 [Acipenser ruthenus]
MEEEESETTSWSPVQRERLFTFTSISDISGKKRKQGTVTGNASSVQLPEDKQVDEAIADSGTGKDAEEPSNKRVKPVSKGTGLASLMGPVKSTSLKRIGQSISRSISFKTEARPFPAAPLRPRVKNTPSKRRNSLLWSDTVESISEELSAKEIKRQEVIFELTQGEQQLVDDLSLAKKAYYEPMLKLDIMTENELMQIFGTLDSLIPIHEDLWNRLQTLRGSEGTVHEVGPTLMEWFPCLDSYITYCCNLVAAKALLDHKKQERRVDEFLRLCQESSFSRKLDLWNFLDLPRSRLVKYPLLLKEILRHTSSEHPDLPHLEEAMELIQRIVGQVNSKTGEAESQYYQSSLCFQDDNQRLPEIQRSRLLHCHGELKNSKGQKLHVFLFELVLVLTRPVSHSEVLQFQVYRQPIPIADLLLEELPDGEVGMGGSFRGAFTSTNDRAKNFFRVSSRGRWKGQAHSLQASDSFNKQQWVSCIRQAIISFKDQLNSSHRSLLNQSADSSLDDIADLSIDSDEKVGVDVEMS